MSIALNKEPKLRMADAKLILKAIVLQNLDLRSQGVPMSSLNVPYLLGEPGIGKTSIVDQVTKEVGIGFEPLILAQYDLGDLGGLPYLAPLVKSEKIPKEERVEGGPKKRYIETDEKQYRRARPFFMPTEGRGILFLDEVTQAFMANQNIAAQLVNEGRIGEHILPKGWIVVLASNEATNRAGTNPMPSHLKDRLNWLPCGAYYKDVVELFHKKKLDERLPAYLRWRPDFLSKFNPDEDVCPSPRSWEKVASHLSNPYFISEEHRRRAIVGAVGEAAAADFHAFLGVWEKMPNPDDVIKDPRTAAIPKEEDIKYALCAALSARANETNAGSIVIYAERLLAESSGEYGIYLVRDAIDRSGGLKSKLATRSRPIKSFLRNHGTSMYEMYADLPDTEDDDDVAVA